jgi:hypothetical protein
MAFGEGVGERLFKVKEAGVHVGLGIGRSGTGGEGGVRVRAGGYTDDGEK